MIAIEVREEKTVNDRSITRVGRMEFEDLSRLNVNVHETVAEILKGFQLHEESKPKQVEPA